MQCYDCTCTVERKMSINGPNQGGDRLAVGREVDEVKIPVLIETISNQRYRATGGEPFGGCVEGETPEAALREMKRRIEDRIAGGARIAAVALPDTHDLPAVGPGMFRESLLYDAWQQAMADYRQSVDDRPDAP